MTAPVVRRLLSGPQGTLAVATALVYPSLTDSLTGGPA